MVAFGFVISVVLLTWQVYETASNNHMVDTGHSRAARGVGNSFVQIASAHTAPTPYLHESRHSRTASTGSSSCPTGRQSTVARGTLTQTDGVGSRPTVNTAAGQDSVSYVLDVKRALTLQPAVYRQFVDLLRRYHDNHRRHHGNRHHDNQCGADRLNLDAVRRIVYLLRASTPRLVLGFNDFLPHGYRICMLNQSTYVIEYPDHVSGMIGRIIV